MAGASERSWYWVIAGWLGLSLALICFFVLSPVLAPTSDKGVRLGTDVPMRLLIDPAGTLQPDEVAALPDAAFEWLHQPLNKGYTREVHWLRLDALEPGERQRRWLQILPTYLDHVTLYQQEQGIWQAQHSGDTVPMAQRLHVRQLMFALQPAQPALLRVQTTSPMQVDATVWRSRYLMANLSATEWASGLHQGVNLFHALLMLGAALALRLRGLVAVTVSAWVTLIHGAGDRGYLQLWLPSALSHWGDVAVSVGTLALPMALSWQFRENLTKGTPWRVADRLLLAFGVLPLLALVSIPLGRYSDWAWTGIVAPWLIGMTVAVVSWLKLRREGLNAVSLTWLGPGLVSVGFGVFVVATYLGLIPLMNIETSVLWQLNILLSNLMATLAVGVGLVRQYIQAVARLQQSEKELEARVSERTGELEQARQWLADALDSERQAREEQRQFFQMVSHEFRTPLTIMDSAATELLTFPTHELEPQMERAAQIRRACRRMSGLVDNCLTSERLQAEGFGLRLQEVALYLLVRDLVQPVQWSQRHQLRLELGQLPELWVCDPMLVRIALSNLLDNALKYAAAGEIVVRGECGADGRLRLSVCDPGPGLLPAQAEQLFARGARGKQASSGFGLGLWVSRRIAQLHGGNVEVSAATGGGCCFVLVLGASEKEDDLALS